MEMRRITEQRACRAAADGAATGIFAVHSRILGLSASAPGVTLPGMAGPALKQTERRSSNSFAHGLPPRDNRGMRTRLLLLAMLICAALPVVADARPSVVVDADMSFDDAATLAYLAQADRHGFIDLEAVTVSLSGAGYTGRGLSHARCLLRKHGLHGVPVSDGDALGANPLPEAIRSYVDRVVHNAAALGD